MNWLQRHFHTCSTPPPETFAPVDGREWTCPKCGAEWEYTTRTVAMEVDPAVWDRWADVQDVPVTAWWRKAA